MSVFKDIKDLPSADRSKFRAALDNVARGMCDGIAEELEFKAGVIPPGDDSSEGCPEIMFGTEDGGEWSVTLGKRVDGSLECRVVRHSEPSGMWGTGLSAPSGDSMGVIGMITNNRERILGALRAALLEYAGAGES